MAAGMPQKWYWAARWKWILDTGVVHELYNAGVSDALRIAGREKWRDPATVVPDMVELAMAEILWPGRFRNDEARRTWLGWSKGSWGRRRYQYEEVYRLVDGWTASAYGYLVAAQR